MTHAQRTNQAVKRIEHVTLNYSIQFKFAFDVEHPLTKNEFVELAQKAVSDLKAELPQHVEEYPQLILKELFNRKLIDVATFREHERA